MSPELTYTWSLSGNKLCDVIQSSSMIALPNCWHIQQGILLATDWRWYCTSTLHGRLLQIRTSRKKLRFWVLEGTPPSEMTPLQSFRAGNRHEYIQTAFCTSAAATPNGMSGTHAFGDCTIPAQEVVSLGLVAYQEVFSMHKSLYAPVLQYLQQRLHIGEFANRNLRTEHRQSNEHIQSKNRNT